MLIFAPTNVGMEALMHIETYQDEDTLLWGYIVYDRSKKPVTTSPALYDTSQQARRAACDALEDADIFH